MLNKLECFISLYYNYFESRKVDLLEEIIILLDSYEWFFNIEYCFSIQEYLPDKKFFFIINSENFNFIKKLQWIMDRFYLIDHKDERWNIFWIWFTFDIYWQICNFEKYSSIIANKIKYVHIIEYDMKRNLKKNISYKEICINITLYINTIQYHSMTQFLNKDTILLRFDPIFDSKIHSLYNLPPEISDFRMRILFMQMNIADFKGLLKNYILPVNYKLYFTV